jgi:hypothetical protein
MAFVLKQKDSYTWPVPLLLPGDGGRREKSTFDAEFKRLPQSRLSEIGKAVRASELALKKGEEPENEIDAHALAREMLIGWSGITDDNGKEVPFSESALAQLLDMPSVAAQIVRAFYESYEDAKRKN